MHLLHRPRDLIQGLKKILKSATKKGNKLDGVIIETTGLADPSPVAQTFFMDPFVQRNLSLDGILTLVDAKHVIQHLDEEKPEGAENEAVQQIAFADRILLNKCDLVGEEELKEVERRCLAINGTVKIKRTVQSKVDMEFILGIRAFSLDKVMTKADEFLDENMTHGHDPRVSSVGIEVDGECDMRKLNDWIGWLVKEKGQDVYRYKGVLAVRGMTERFVFQGIHMMFMSIPQRPWENGEKRTCKMVFIGKNLDRQELLKGFKSCLN